LDAAGVLNANHPFNVSQHRNDQEVYVMTPPRPSRETIEILRRTLMQVQAEFHPVRDAEAMAELESIILRRIALLRLALETPSALPIAEPSAAPSQLSAATAKPPTDNAA
jgi:hypothetical protein